MKRKELSDSELDLVIKLRQGSASWLGIQNKTGIPRRVAKRVYENWEHSQSLEELKAARRDVAGEEFRKHLRCLTLLAECLLDCLCVPSSPNETRNADEFLGQLYLRDIYQEAETGGTSWPGGEKETRRIQRQNQMLFKSLQSHTRQEVHWEALEEWKQAWNACIKALNGLRTEASEVVENILNQKPNLKNKVQKGSGKKDAVKRMMKGVLATIWSNTLVGNLDQGTAFARTILHGQGATEVTFGERDLTVGLIFTEKDLAEEVTGVCNWAAQNLCIRDTVQRVANEVCTMQTRIDELEVMLDPLVLRPLLVRTRCDLCPA